MKHTPILRTSALGLGLAFTLMTAAACGGDSPASEQPTRSAADPSLRAALPQEIQDRGELKVATSLYPPVDFYEADGKTLKGFDHELVEEMARRMGVTVSWSVIDFAAIIPGIQSGQYDFATDLNDTVEREAVVDFVTEFRDGTSILVKEGNPKGISDLASLCGKAVVVTKGSTQIKLIEKQNATCPAPIRKLEVPDDPDAILTMRNGRADAYLVNTLAGSYAVKEGNLKGFVVLDDVYDEVYAGIVFPKNKSQLRDAVHAAMIAMIDDGFYGKVLRSYGLESNMIDSSRINAAAG